MTLAQYLAMLEAGGAYQPTPAPPQAQTNINWGAVAGQPLPDPTRAYTYDPIEVTAERLPQTFEQPEMASLPFQELYGGGVREQPASQALAFAPASAPMKLPPLPVKGAAQPRPMANVIDIRPPSMPSDAAPEPTPTYMGAAQPGADIAMLADEQPAAVATQAAEEPKPAPKPWQIGQPFQFTLGKNTYTVQKYEAVKGDQGVPTIASPTITMTDDKGNEYSYRRSVAPTVFAEAEKTMQQKLEESRKMMPQDGFTSYLVINGQQVPAMIQPDEQGVNRIYYQTDEMPAPAEVRNINNLVEGETFISPPDTPDLLETIKSSRKNFVAPLVDTARGISGSLATQYTPEELRVRLMPVLGPNPTEQEKEQGNFVPAIKFDFRTDSGRVITMDEAVASGLMTSAQATAVTEAAAKRTAEANEAVRTRQVFQGAEPKSMTEQDIQRLKTQKQQAETDLAQARAAAAAAPGDRALRQRADDLQGAVRDLDQRIARAYTQGRAVSGPGGTTIVEGTAQTVVESFDPTTPTGAASVFGTGAPANMQSRAWDLEDIGRMAIDDAVKKMPSAATYVSKDLGRGVDALQQRLLDIQADASEKMGADAPEVLDLPATFTYIVRPGEKEAVVTTLRQAVGDAKLSSEVYQRIASDPNATPDELEAAKQQMIHKHQVLSGKYSILYPGDTEPTEYMASPGLALLGRTSEWVQRPWSPSAAIPGQRTIAPAERVIQPAAIDVVRPPGSGRTPPPVTRVPAFPMIYIGASQTNPSGYVKFDAGFNYFDRTKVNAQTYKETNDRFQPANSEGATLRNIAMAAFNEDGNPTSATKQALSKTIDDMNAEIIKDGNEAIRLDFVDIFHRQLEVLGARPLDGASQMATDLENIRTLAKNGNHAGAQAAVESFRDKYGRQAITKFRNSSELWTRLQTLSGSPGAWGTSTAGRWAIEAQIVGAVEDIAYLFKQSGYGDTKVLNRGAGRSTVTWIPNIASDRKQQSVITLPVANTDTTRASADPRPLAQATANPFDLSTTAQTGQTAILEPTTNRLLIQLDSVRAPMSSLLDKLTQLPSLSALVRQGESNVTGYNRNLKANNTSRPDEDEAVEVTPATQTSIKKYAVGEILLYSMMPSNRIRTYSWFQ